MEFIFAALGLTVLVGLAMLFIRRWRRIGFFILGGSVALIVLVGTIQDRAAVDAGFQDALDQREATEAGFTDSDEWAPERARLDAEEEERERQEAAAAAEREREEQQAEIEERRKGFHCLSSWDGSHANLNQAVKEMARNPSSFEHIETRITPVNDQGNHSLVMSYRAENGFGGMTIGRVLATIQQSNCDYSIDSIE